MYLKGNFGMGIATRKKITPTRDRSQSIKFSFDRHC